VCLSTGGLGCALVQSAELARPYPCLLFQAQELDRGLSAYIPWQRLTMAHRHFVFSTRGTLTRSRRFQLLPPIPAFTPALHRLMVSHRCRGYQLPGSLCVFNPALG
jgi:hypothetical protein